MRAGVQYDVMGRAMKSDKERMGGGAGDLAPEQETSNTEVLGESAARSMAAEKETAIDEDLLQKIGLRKRTEGEGESSLDTNEAKQDNGRGHEASPVTSALNSGVLVRSASSTEEAISISPNSSSTTVSASAALSTTSQASSPDTLATLKSVADISPSSSHEQTIDIQGGRTLSQLLSHGLTTPNLTSPLEHSCFNLNDHAYTHDNLNNTGHWHQGSNSLRLIVCARDAFRARSCLTSAHDAKQYSKGKHEQMTYEEYENTLREEGLIVHFSIIHRKFSNSWELPMRYERYFLVWEGRRPFRILGVSRWPMLFRGERARPWSVAEDVEWDLKRERKKSWGRDEMEVQPRVADDGEDKEEAQGWEYDRGHQSNYFTYTPSIAWAWRGRSAGEDEALNRRDGHEDLGTGYLGDTIVVGVGIDDAAHSVVRVKVEAVLACIKVCNGVSVELVE